ncbi:MAG: hypothetical protein PHV03_01835 [Desulfitobacteriaceae bacterium]|nr:hypothetical protein [Desulfitobacteriaceae bacterium]
MLGIIKDNENHYVSCECSYFELEKIETLDEAILFEMGKNHGWGSEQEIFDCINVSVSDARKFAKMILEICERIEVANAKNQIK